MDCALPSMTETAFVCPHCGAFAQQDWHSLMGDNSLIEDGVPLTAREIIANEDFRYGDEAEKFSEKVSNRSPFFFGNFCYEIRFIRIYNLYLSVCYNCKDVAIWISGNMIYPQHNNPSFPNPDLPEDIRRIYDEASSILERSPRGAAALIRLAIQKLVIELGYPGNNLMSDIQQLVRDGLDPRVGKMLDLVRMIGNQAVHPGQIDLEDDHETAKKLLVYLNLIAEKMISEPKRMEEAEAILQELSEATSDNSDRRK